MVQMTPSNEWPVDLKRMNPEEYIPWEYQQYFCICPNPGVSPNKFSQDDASRKCLTCGKWHRWLLIKKCWTCGEPYFHWYHHPDRKNYTGRPTCYSCVCAEYGVKNTVPPPDITPRVLPTMDELMSEEFEEIEDF